MCAGAGGRLGGKPRLGLSGKGVRGSEAGPSQDHQAVGSLSWLEGRQGQLVTGVTKDVFAGGRPATSSHPSAHGRGGLPHQLPADHLPHG